MCTLKSVWQGGGEGRGWEVVRAADHTWRLRAVGAGRASQVCVHACGLRAVNRAAPSGMGEVLSPRTHWLREGLSCKPGEYGQWARCSVAMVGQGSTVQGTARRPYQGRGRGVPWGSCRRESARNGHLASRASGRLPSRKRRSGGSFAAPRQASPVRFPRQIQRPPKQQDNW